MTNRKYFYNDKANNNGFGMLPPDTTFLPVTQPYRKKKYFSFKTRLAAIAATLALAISGLAALAIGSFNANREKVNNATAACAAAW